MIDPFLMPSFAKINWTLRVLGKRDDGFHEIVTIYQTISLYDTIRFAAADEIELTIEGADLPMDENNLIVRAAKVLRERTGKSVGARVHLIKRIPSPGGLAGGSSNAAVALIGLSKLWQIDDLGLITSLAREIGSDVPFFLTGGTAFGSGRGEIIEPMDDVTGKLLIVTPPVAVSTADAYRGLAAVPLTSVRSEPILRVCRKTADSFDPVGSVIENDFEQSVFAMFPEIADAKQRLLDLGAVNASLSGSGASVFAIFDNEETRQAAYKALDQESTWRKFVVSTISRQKYREALMI